MVESDVFTGGAKSDNDDMPEVEPAGTDCCSFYNFHCVCWSQTKDSEIDFRLDFKFSELIFSKFY